MRRLQPYLFPLLAVLSLLLGAAYYLAGRRGAVPPEGVPVFYPLVMLYNYTAAPLATTILLVAVTLAALWIPQVLRRMPRYQVNGLAAGLALAGSVLACAGFVPQMLVSYRHLDRAELNGQVYQLGLRLAIDGDNYFVLCGCGRLGLTCRCRRLVEAQVPDVTEIPQLEADPGSGTLSVRIGAQTVYSGQP